MAVRAQRPTLEAFLSWPDEKPYLELIHGEVRPKSMPDFPHGELQAEMARLLGNWSKPLRGRTMTEQRCLLEVDGERHVVLPDVAWWSAERLPHPAVGPQTVPPLLAVEILSPHDRYGDVEDKVSLYLKSQIQVVWVLDPQARNVTGHRPERIPQVLAAHDFLEDPLFTGLRIPLVELFSICDPPPLVQD